MNGDAERGMKLLSKKVRGLHPRAQVQSLHRIATRALGQADRAIQYIDLAKDPAEARADAAAKRQKAEDAAAAMIRLNADHNLGYPVR